MTVSQAGKNLSAALTQLYDHREAAGITEMVIEKITGLTKTQRLINKEAELTTQQQQQLQHFTDQLLQSRPVQYVLHEAWFCGINFYVDENVLIPRPETEELVDTVLAQSFNKKYSVIDIGTGSGCIAISLKKKLPLLNVTGLDISEKALRVAKENAKRNHASVEFLQANILKIDPAIQFPAFDIIVSNPPYIKLSEKNEMSPNVLVYEPHEALFVPDNDPLVFYNAIADFGLQHLNGMHGKIFFEINEAMGNAVKGLLQKKGFSKIRIKKDLQEKDRIISAVLIKDQMK